MKDQIIFLIVMTVFMIICSIWSVYLYQMGTEDGIKTILDYFHAELKEDDDDAECE